MEGYIKLPRDVFYDPSFDGEKFSRREAFLDLVQMAYTEQRDIQYHGKIIHVDAGDVVCSVRSLAARWGWSKSKVQLVFKEFEIGQRIGRKMDGLICVISITSYSDYISELDCPMDKQRETYPLSPPLDGPSSLSPTTPITTSPLSPPIIPQKEKNARAISSLDVERLYSLYPTKCVVSGRPTGKSYKDKTKLATILKNHTPDEIEKTIKRYIDECRNSRSFMKNFSTFLNNLPDYSVEPAREVKKDDSVYVVSERRTEDGLYERKYSNGFTTITDK